MQEIRRLPLRVMGTVSTRKRAVSEFLCPQCGNIVVKRRSNGRRDYTCSQACARKYRYDAYRAPRKERIGTGRGYWAVLRHDHPNASADGYVLEHRLIMEKKISRYLTKDEVVHHINGVRKDNQIENLLLMDANEHRSFHTKGRRSPAAKLSDDDVRAARKMYVDNTRVCDIALTFKISGGAASQLVHNKSYRDVS